LTVIKDTSLIPEPQYLLSRYAILGIKEHCQSYFPFRDDVYCPQETKKIVAGAEDKVVLRESFNVKWPFTFYMNTDNIRWQLQPCKNDLILARQNSQYSKPESQGIILQHTVVGYHLAVTIGVTEYVPRFWINLAILREIGIDLEIYLARWTLKRFTWQWMLILENENFYVNMRTMDTTRLLTMSASDGIIGFISRISQ
jgi:hypothetical protein